MNEDKVLVSVGMLEDVMCALEDAYKLVSSVYENYLDEDYGFCD